MGDGFYRSKDPTNSIKVLKEGLQTGADGELLLPIVLSRTGGSKCKCKYGQNNEGRLLFDKRFSHRANGVQTVSEQEVDCGKY